MVRNWLLISFIGLVMVISACSGGGQSDATTVSGAVPDAASGEQIYERLGCDGCHAESSAVDAPSLVGLVGTEVQLDNGETVTVDEEYLRESILTPQAKIVAGYQPIMPEYEGQITDEELDALVAYIQSLSD